MKNKFPIFSNNKNLVYLDSAATAQKPKAVIDAMTIYYENYNANINRGAYALSDTSSKLYERGREDNKRFINARHSNEVIFTKGTTESINIVATSYGMTNIKGGDEVALLISEHHSNVLPWQKVCSLNGSKLVYLYFDENFELTENELNKINDNTKLVSFAMISNVIGLINPIRRLIKKAHQHGALVLLDAAQAVAHIKIDVQELDVDFLCYSAHKMYGPFGVGVLYAKQSLLAQMEPVLYGGDMVEYVFEHGITYADLPNKFEGGTQNPASVFALSAAIEFIEGIGFDYIINHDASLLRYTQERMSEFSYINILAEDVKDRSSIISITMDDIHPHDIASVLDSKCICVRAGHHCAQPFLRWLGLLATTRISFGIYNDKEDIDRLIHGLLYVRELFLD